MGESCRANFLDSYTRVIKAGGTSYGVDQISTVLLFSQAQNLQAAAGPLRGLASARGYAPIPARAEHQILALRMSFIAIFTQTAVILSRGILLSAGPRRRYRAAFTAGILERAVLPTAAVGCWGTAAGRKLRPRGFCCRSLVGPSSRVCDSSCDGLPSAAFLMNLMLWDTS